MKNKYEVINQNELIESDKKNINSDCWSISFTNQGTSDVNIYPQGSGAARLLSTNQSAAYGSNDPNIKYISKYNVTFSDNTKTTQLLIEREFINNVKCEND